MSDLLSWMKEIYLTGMKKELNWKPLYPNNIPNNGIAGLYTDMIFKQGKTYTYMKFTIQYCYRIDENGEQHEEEGIKYYVVHELWMHDLRNRFQIPEPSNDIDINNGANLLVNNYGHFRSIYESEDVAKKAVMRMINSSIYHYAFLLEEKEIVEWSEFLQKNGENIC